MQGNDREAFERGLAELFGAIDKPLTEAKREAFWKGLSRMSLVEFSRCCDHILRELGSKDTPKNFGVSDVWNAKRSLRATGPHAVIDGSSAPDLRADIARMRAQGVQDPRTDLTVRAKLTAYLEQLTAGDDAERRKDFSGPFWNSAWSYLERALAGEIPLRQAAA